MPASTEPPYDLTTPDLVAYTGLPKSYWYGKAAEIPHYKLARKLWWRRADVDAFIQKHLVGAELAEVSD